MVRKAVPKGWADYSCFKSHINGTRIIPLKTPLKESAFANRPTLQRWTPGDVMNAIPNLGLIINLCNTPNPYYVIEEFKNNGVDFISIRCAGQEVPGADVVQEFKCCVNAFLAEEMNENKLIGVHCTHGVNRTGYIVCRYLIDCLEFDAHTAIREFENARGHSIDRINYTDALKDL